MFTLFSEVQNSNIANVTSCSPSDPQFGGYVQEAAKRLLARGDWVGTVVPIRTCVQRGCLVWPRYVDHVRRIADCRGNIPLHGMFFDFLDWHDQKWQSQSYWDGLHAGHRRNCINKGFTPVFQDILGEGRYVQMNIEVPEDIGATCTLIGVDNNNQRLRTRNVDGMTWSDGWTLTATTQNQSPQTSGFVRRIDRVIKSPTQGNMTLWGVNSAVVSTYQFGYLYNIDTGQNVSLTIDGLPGSQSLNLGGFTTPGSAAIGFLWNADLNSWAPVVARGTGPFYLDFNQPAANSNYGGQAYNPTTMQFEQLVVRGAPGAQYIEIGTAFAPNSTGNYLEPIAEYEPSETNPKYVKQELHMGCQLNLSPGGTPPGVNPSRSVVALVKLRQIQPVNPNDIIVIQNLQALKLAVQAVVAGEANEFQEEQECMLAAVQELNRELEDWLPIEQIPVAMGELGHAYRIGQTKCF
jgi:hypothetical protein